jgi:hypothetical protein
MKSGTGSTDKGEKKKKINYNKNSDTTECAENWGGGTWLREGISIA